METREKFYIIGENQLDHFLFLDFCRNFVDMDLEEYIQQEKSKLREVEVR